MPYIPVEKGVKIFVNDLNPSGKPVLFIHGWPANHRMFEYQFAQLPKHGFRCIGIDIRGFGKSDKPWDGYSYNCLADDLRCVIEALDLEDIALIGFSVGGAIATRYMTRHSGYGISKLGLVSAAVPKFTQSPDYPYGFPISVTNDIIRQTYTDRPKMISDLKFFASNISPASQNWFNSLCLEASVHATARLAMSFRDADVREEIQEICVPTAIFHGIQDKIVPFPSAEVTHQCITNSVLIPFEFSGHGLVIDEIDKFNYCLTEFLNA